MDRVLLAGRTILFELKTIGIVLLVLEAIVIAILALGAFKRDLQARRFGSHCVKTPYKKITPRRCMA